MSVTANISNISRCSVHDGPGVRTVVFFKGCGLRCRWCHNPETLSVSPEILFARVKCIHCGRCVSVCPEHHRIEGSEMVFLRDGCNKCGKCAEACPSGALTVSGVRKTLDEVWKEVYKDRHFYQVSGGGVTLSGGECLLQADFAAELLKKCREAGIHTAVETALFVPWENVEKIIPYCDLFLADFKTADAEKHRAYTGRDNRLIIENLQRLAGKAPGRVLVRTPLIPGVNDSPEDLAQMAGVLRSIAKKLQGIELLKYNALAEGKYQLAGMAYESFGSEAQSDEYVQKLCTDLSRLLDGLNVFCTA